MRYQEKPLFSQPVRSYMGKLLPSSIYLKYIGRHENLSLSLWRFLSARAPADSAILDIGAYEGEFALEAQSVNENSEIYAFEPNPESLRTLRTVCKEKGISVVEKALFDENKEVFFQCNSQISTISVGTENPEGVLLEAVTLDSWIQEAGILPFLLKIDVEDAIGAVLSGSRATLEDYRPIIICEILDDKAGEEAMKILPPNYDYFLINENNGLDSHTEVRRYDWRYKNWLLVPKEKDDLIQKFKSNRS